MMRKALVLAGISALIGTQFAHALSVSSNVVGYSEMAVSETDPFTLCAFANPFNNGDNKLNTILPLGPDLAEVYTWDGIGFQPFVFVEGAWILPAGTPSLPTLAPGEGFWYHLPTPLPVNPYTVVFVGEVPQGTVTRTVGMGFQMVGPPAGWAGYRTGTLASQGFPAADLDQFFFYHCDTLSWESGLYLGAYFPGDAPLTLPQATWTAKDTAPADWSQTVNLHGPTDVVDPAVVLSAWARSGSTFTFRFSTKGGVIYRVQTKTTPAGAWSNMGGLVVGTGTSIRFTDNSATGATKIYRVAH
jgi:hypothetical protein